MNYFIKYEFNELVGGAIVRQNKSLIFRPSIPHLIDAATNPLTWPLAAPFKSQPLLNAPGKFSGEIGFRAVNKPIQSTYRLNLPLRAVGVAAGRHGGPASGHPAGGAGGAGA
jgi:hypothetical protein